MKNKLLILLLILFQISCSKDNSSNPEDGDAGMLKKIIKHVSSNSTDTFDFYYSDGNKLNKVILNTNDATRDFNTCTIHYIYENDLIINTFVYYDANPVEEIINNFYYSVENKIVKYERISKFSGVTYLDTFNYNHLSNGNIERECISETVSTTFSSTIIFDSNSNVISGSNYFDYNNIGYYVYDNKLSPYSGIKGVEKIYFVNQLNNFDTFPDYYHNNIGYTNSVNPDPSIFYTFTYNSENKPLLIYEPLGSLYNEYFYY
ncbi:MAG: hypothetical protein ACI924_001823 [Flavobacterium sp.]|jgi:hypothetical protein